MSHAIESDERVTDKRTLIEYLEQGCRPKADWRIGTEHEKIGYQLDDLRPLPYEGDFGICAMLKGLQRFDWLPVFERGNVIALTKDGQSISLEPGGQFELSGAMLETIHETCAEVNAHLGQVREVAEELGVGFIGIGMQPKWGRNVIPVMPKRRYDIMRAYMPTKGDRGLDMMLRTCTVQVNLDFASEADMVKKFRIALALQPIATALFANSPFVDGKPSGFLSTRSETWFDTDPDRCGIPRFVFEEGMSFERYVDFALDVPMYFVRRGDDYIDASGQSFRDFLTGELPALPGEQPTFGDWSDHLTTIFTEVRLKQFLEMRGADAGSWNRLCALPALWVGLLYDSSSLDAAAELVRDWKYEEIVDLRAKAARSGLRADFRGYSVRDIAGQMLDLASEGLKRRACLDNAGSDETGFLTPLRGVVQSGRTLSEELLDAFNGRWSKTVDPLFGEFSY
ncbi:MAG: glutamate--cysteine ligase [Alphaproteobacteria bacterium]